MPWLKIDDGFANHPKIMKAGNSATGLWVRCASHCAQYLTDGHVAPEIVRMYGKQRDVETLLEVGLIARNGDGGYVIPDYLEFNPSKEQVLAERAHARERQAKKRRDNAGKFE